MELLDYVNKYRLPQDILDYNFTLEFDQWAKHQWYAPGQAQEQDISDPKINYICDKEAHSIFSPVIYDLVKKYCREHSPDKMIKYMSPPRLNKYDEGDYMKEHADLIYSLFREAPPEKQGVPVISVITDVSEEYTGGELIICGQDMQMITGDVIIFPSAFMYRHEVLPVTSGTRISIVNWAW
tara:strand:+ start:63 stop:608 length:546 start_codon:yes stop_codon:yes gene_type:complete